MTTLTDQTIAASADDALSCTSYPNNSTTQSPHFTPQVANGTPTYTGYRFTLDSAIPHGSTFNTGCFLSLYWGAFGGAPAAKIYAELASAPTAYSTSRYPHQVSSITTTIAQWTMPNNGSAQYNDSPDLADVLNDLMSNKGDSNDITHINLIITADNDATGNYHTVSSYDTGTNLPLLTVVYTAGAGGGGGISIPVVQHHRQRNFA